MNNLSYIKLEIQGVIYQFEIDLQSFLNDVRRNPEFIPISGRVYGKNLEHIGICDCQIPTINGPILVTINQSTFRENTAFGAYTGLIGHISEKSKLLNIPNDILKLYWVFFAS